MIYLLLAVSIIIFLLSYFTLGRDLFQPACLVSISYIVSILCACINQDIWDYTYHMETVEVIAAGLFVFYFVNFFMYINKKKIHFRKRVDNRMSLIFVNKLILMGIVIFQFVALVVYYREVVRISGGGINYAAMMNSFRMITYSSELSVSGIVRQFAKISFVCAQIFVFIFVNNAVIGGLKRNYCNLIPVLIYALQTLVSGARFNILVLVFVALIIFNILWHKKNGWKTMLNFKTVLRILMGICIMFVAFYWIRTLVGRHNDSNFLTYIASYAGGSIPLFDMFLQDPVSSSCHIWGAETFYGLLGDLKSSGLIEYADYSSHLEFRSNNGVLIGNVYTAFRREISDFGITGMLLLQMLCSAILSGCYNKKQNFTYSGILFYAMSAYPLFLHSINDSFYMSIVSIGTLYTFLITFAIFRIVTRLNIITGNTRSIQSVSKKEIYF